MLRIGVIEIQVRNFRESVKFYTKKLGLKVFAIEPDDKFAMFDTGEAKLSLWETKNPEKSNKTKIYFPVTDIHKTVKRLTKKDVKFTSKIEKRHWGYRISFVDSEQNEHFLYQET